MRFDSQPLAAFASQLPYPAEQVSPHAPEVHVAVPFAGTGQTVHAAPQAAGSLSPAPAGTHFAPQRWLPAGQVAPQVSFTHVAVPPAGTGQGVHAAPHWVGSVFATHLPVHAWKLALHVKEQVAAAHATVAFATTGHFTLHPPQLFTLVFGSTHSAPQARGAPAVQPLVHWNVGPEGAQSGAAAPQTALHAPQLVAFERSTSQPSALFALQSE
jgi:hypothetical protein